MLPASASEKSQRVQCRGVTGAEKWNYLEMSAAESKKKDEITLGGQLRHFRRKLCLRQPEMARHLGVSMSLYSKLEANLLVSPPHTVARFASILNTTVEFLTRGTGPESVPPQSDNAPGQDAAGKAPVLTDENLRRIIRLAQREDLREAAETVAKSMKSTPEHALAVIIRTILLDAQNL